MKYDTPGAQIPLVAGHNEANASLPCSGFILLHLRCRFAACETKNSGLRPRTPPFRFKFAADAGENGVSVLRIYLSSECASAQACSASGRARRPYALASSLAAVPSIARL